MMLGQRRRRWTNADYTNADSTVFEYCQLLWSRMCLNVFPIFTNYNYNVKSVWIYYKSMKKCYCEGWERRLKNQYSRHLKKSGRRMVIITLYCKSVKRSSVKCQEFNWILVSICITVRQHYWQNESNRVVHMSQINSGTYFFKSTLIFSFHFKLCYLTLALTRYLPKEKWHHYGQNV